MDREILFRGKSISIGEWTEGNFVHRKQGVEYIRNNDSLLKVDPATVGQFTGLCDKNGVKIFEGDLFVNPSNRLMVIETPINKPAFYALVVSDKTLGYPLIFENMSSREVIGNIHDNPELLEEESE